MEFKEFPAYVDGISEFSYSNKIPAYFEKRRGKDFTMLDFLNEFSDLPIEIFGRGMAVISSHENLSRNILFRVNLTGYYSIGGFENVSKSKYRIVQSNNLPFPLFSKSDLDTLSSVIEIHPVKRQKPGLVLCLYPLDRVKKTRL